MATRTARCTYFNTCGSETTLRISPNLAFWQAKDEGSAYALNTCAHCRYARIAHERKQATNERHLKDVCDNFEAKGAADHDEYYCGCKGWD